METTHPPFFILNKSQYKIDQQHFTRDTNAFGYTTRKRQAATPIIESKRTSLRLLLLCYFIAAATSFCAPFRPYGIYDRR